MNIIDPKLNIGYVPKLNKPKNIIIHHALAKNCTIHDIHKWHKGFGWAGFGYHFFIDKKGHIYKGREENQRGSHCKEQRMNFKSIGICLEGCYEDYKNQSDTNVPSEQLNALIELTRHLMGKYSISINKVFKHHYFASYKKCPGNYFPWDLYINKLENNELEKATRKIKELLQENLELKEAINQAKKLFERWN